MPPDLIFSFKVYFEPMMGGPVALYILTHALLQHQVQEKFLQQSP